MKFHFLLSYAGRNELENMAESDKVALLQKIVALPGSEESWNAILELFAAWPESPAKQSALDWADSALDSWNDEVRSLRSSSSYIYENGGLANFTRIARSVEINNREVHGNEELTIIAMSPQLSRLRRLSIYRSEIYREGFQALVTASWLNGLTHLSLASLTLHREELVVLCTSTAFKNLSVLTLRNVGLQQPKLQVLLNAPFLRQLTLLDLSHNSISPEETTQLKNLFKHMQLIV